MEETRNCPVCGNVDGNLLIDHRAGVPLLQNTTLATQAKARAYLSGVLDMCRCSECGFIWNDAFDADAISYDNNYNNDVSTSGYYVQHIEAMADRVFASVPAHEPIHYVEVGCGEADFLKLVVKKSKGRCVSAIGFDPSFTAEDELPDNCQVYKSFFGTEQLHRIPAQMNVGTVRLPLGPPSPRLHHMR